MFLIFRARTASDLSTQLEHNDFQNKLIDLSEMCDFNLYVSVSKQAVSVSIYFISAKLSSFLSRVRHRP